ncbi:MAG TPA: glycosyltransferase family 39 protein [Xanthobacteraceae bacterium]|nr:glycosyltransferase family 39 protein [Xanthobacteraceae bacterium]
MTISKSDTRRASQAWKGLPALVDFAVASHARASALLLALALIAFLPGFFQIPPVDRDEARFAQATKQMVETGDYIDIRFQDEVRYKKPAGIYWLQAAVVNGAEAAGIANAHTTIWLYRIPSLLGAIGAVLLTYWTTLAFASRRAAVLAGVMLASSILLGVEARLAKTDAMLLCATVAAMGALARIYLSRGDPPSVLQGLTLPAIFWTALAGGILLKGPVIVMVAGLTVGTLTFADRSARWLWQLRPLPGLLWVLLLCLPWFAAIMHRAGDTFLIDSIGKDLLEKVASGQETHGAPPGTYLLLFWLTFWPAAPLAALAAPAVWAARHEWGTRFLLAWIVPSWIVFEIVATKLPHYVLPLYPAIAILAAGAMNAGVLSQRRWLVYGASWWFIIPLVAGVGVIIGAVYLTHDLHLLAWPFAAAALIMGLLAWRLYEADGAEKSLLRAAAASIFMALTVYGALLPAMTELFPSVTLARIERQSGCAGPAVSAGYQEPSLIFLGGTRTILTDGRGAADFLALGGCRLAFVESRQERSFVTRADAIGLRYAAGPRFEAIDFSGGHFLSIAVYRSQAERP